MKRFAYWVSLIFGNPAFAFIVYVCLFHTGLNHHQFVLFSYIMWTLQVIIPALYFVWALKTKRISDIDITIREQRFELLTILFIGNTLTCIVAYLYGPPLFFYTILSLYIASTVVYAIMRFWKISLHMTHNTMWIVPLIILDANAYKYYYLLPLLLPLIAWSRIVLHKHTPAQLLAGTLVPGGIIIAVYSYIGLI